MLSKFVSTKKEEWDEFLDACVYAYNTAIHESTLFSPFEIMFGRKAILPVEIEVAKEQPAQIVSEPEKDIDTEAVKHLSEKRIEILKSACDNICNAQAKQKLIYDRKHACPNSYQVGDVVLKKDFLRRKRAGKT